MDIGIYLDGHASSRLAPEARDAMQAAWSAPGNAGSRHSAGGRAARIVEDARAHVAALLGCEPGELIFTSGATEANNLAILGCARAAVSQGSHRRGIVVSAIEHRSVGAPAAALRREGFAVHELPVPASGLVDPAALEAVLSADTLLVSIGGANGEIGVVQNLGPLAAAAHRAGALIHSDLAQLAGKLPVDVRAIDLDYASVSAHKLHGPIGIGALFASHLAPDLAPLAHGGGQERGLRPGTVPAPLTAGFGAAAAVASHRIAADAPRLREMADRFLAELSRRQVRWFLNGDPNHRLPGSLNIGVQGISADSLVDRLSEKVAISTGSACQFGEMQTSRVLTAIGLDSDDAKSSFRLLFDRYHQCGEASASADAVAEGVLRERLATGRDLQ